MRRAEIHKGAAQETRTAEDDEREVTVEREGETETEPDEAITAPEVVRMIEGEGAIAGTGKEMIEDEGAIAGTGRMEGDTDAMMAIEGAAAAEIGTGIEETEIGSRIGMEIERGTRTTKMTPLAASLFQTANLARTRRTRPRAAAVAMDV